MFLQWEIDRQCVELFLCLENGRKAKYGQIDLSDNPDYPTVEERKIDLECKLISEMGKLLAQTINS